MPSGLNERRDVSMWEPVQGFADMLAGALRGSTRGLIGLPGDLTEMAPASTGSPVIDALLALARKSDLPTSKSLHKSLPPLRPDKPGAEPSMMEEIGQFIPSPAAAPKATARALGRTAQELATPAMASALRKTAPAAVPMNIVRPEGGNFLAGALDTGPESVGRAAQSPEVTNFLDKKVNNYIRNSFGSPKDPLRGFADYEEGRDIYKTLGIPNDEGFDNYVVQELMDEYKGIPDQNVINGRWYGYHAYNHDQIPVNTWDEITGSALTTLEPKDAKVVLDILRNNTPAERRAIGSHGMTNEDVRLTPEQTNAVFYSSGFTDKDIDEFGRLIDYTTERAPLVFPNKAHGAGGNTMQIKGLRKSLGDFLEVALDPDAQGPAMAQFLRNKKLAMTPKDIEQASIPQIFAKRQAYNKWLSDPANPDSPINKATKPSADAPSGKWMEYDPQSSQLEQGLGAEGTVQSHCVGSYCDQVQSGDSRIISLRDKSGQPKLTVELQPNKGKWYINQVMGKANAPFMKKDHPDIQALINHLDANGELEKWQDAKDLQKDLYNIHPEDRGNLDPAAMEAENQAADAAWEAAGPQRRANWLIDNPGQPIPEGW